MTQPPARVDPPPDADEAGTLVGFLEYHRETLRTKTTGLTSEQLRQQHPPSEMTLGGMLKHLALVEDWWFSCVLLGNEYAAPWDAVDWRSDADWDWHSAVDDDAEKIFALWDQFAGRSREIVRRAIANGGLGQLSKRESRTGETFSLRWIIVHMVEEYARHNGHADLIRESIDGQTGE